MNKLGVINWLVTLLAIIGMFIIIGAVGTMDYMVTIGKEYPMCETVKTSMVGIIMIAPAIIREVR